MRNPFARLAKRDTARPSLRERAASLKASASRVIRREPTAPAEPHPDAALLAAAERARPFIAREEALEAECKRLDAISDQITEKRFGPRPDPHTNWEGVKVYDEKREAVRRETGHSAAWEAASNNNTAIWTLLGPFIHESARTLEGIAAKAALSVSGLWDGDNVAQEMAALFYGHQLEPTDDAVRFTALPIIPNLSGYSVGDLQVTYDALKATGDTLALATAAITTESDAGLLLDDEVERLGHLQDHLAFEIKFRVPADCRETFQRFDVLISQYVQNGLYARAATVAAEAATKSVL